MHAAGIYSGYYCENEICENEICESEVRHVERLDRAIISWLVRNGREKGVMCQLPASGVSDKACGV